MIACSQCNKEFGSSKALNGHMAWHVPRNEVARIIKTKKRAAQLKQTNKKKYMQTPFQCTHCNKVIPYEAGKARKADLKYSTNKKSFCNRSCAASYNNTHKTHGTRRSKLEVYIEEKLPVLYPYLVFHFNRKDAIDSELDIFIPSLKLAFELNGIYHYEPIHGKDKLVSIQNNDNRKFQACLERGIELCIIDSSKLNYFKESNAAPFLEIINKVIHQKVQVARIRS